MVDVLAGVGLAAACAQFGIAAATLGALGTIIWNHNEGYIIIIAAFLLLIIINHFFDQYRAFSILLFLFMIIGGWLVKKK